MNVFWDTNLFIYLFEEHGDLSLATRDLFRRLIARQANLVTSMLTLGELLAGESRFGRPLQPLETLLRQAAMLVPFDDTAARHFATIRADRSIQPPDAIQLACAAAAGVDLFVTNDARLSRKMVPGVPIMTSLAAVPV